MLALLGEEEEAARAALIRRLAHEADEVVATSHLPPFRRRAREEAARPSGNSQQSLRGLCRIAPVCGRHLQVRLVQRADTSRVHAHKPRSSRMRRPRQWQRRWRRKCLVGHDTRQGGCDAVHDDEPNSAPRAAALPRASLSTRPQPRPCSRQGCRWAPTATSHADRRRGAHRRVRGRGKGNRFLADLCTADSLLHVVDASMLTDASGNPTEAAYGHEQPPPPQQQPKPEELASSGVGGGAEAEIEWVSREIHLWVFTNLQAKKDTWRKRPQRLNGMFTGYGASPSLVEGVLRRAAAAAVSEARGGGGEPRPQGLSQSQMAHDPATTIARFAAESEAQLHRLVAHFVASRWPTAVALNKSDHPSAAKRIAACRARFPHRAMVPTSTKRSSKRCMPTRRRAPTSCWGSSELGSNVLDALSQCVALRPPTLVFPCASLQTLALLTRCSPQADDGAPVSHCLQMWPRSTVGDAFAVCKRQQLCSGDFAPARGGHLGGQPSDRGRGVVERPQPRRCARMTSRARASLSCGCRAPARASGSTSRRCSHFMYSRTPQSSCSSNDL